MAIKPTFDTAPELSPITGEASLIIESHHNWEMYLRELPLKLNQNNEWLSEVQKDVSINATQVSLNTSTVVSAKNTAVKAADIAVEAAEGISTVLPDGTISDGTIQDNTAWSSQKIVRQIRSNSPEIIRVDGLLSEVRYADGSKDVLNRNADSSLASIDYYAEDGTTLLYTDTIIRDENNKLAKVERS